METHPLEHGIAKIVPEKGLAQKLALKRPLVVKLGFDPTAPDLHLGHAVVLKKLREFQEAGHRVVFIVGDFTTRIGDPTGKNKARPPLSPEEIEANAKTYLDQVGKVLDVSKIEVRRNSEWLGAMGMDGAIKLMASVTLAQIMERNDFADRYAAGTPISFHELLYPLLQGTDSVEIRADLEMGGTDQLFNIMMGRTLQEARGGEGQVAICMPLLRGIDGSEKMSKSQQNYVGLAEAAHDMYGKLMSIPDDLLLEYLELASSFSAEERAAMAAEIAAGTNPMELKKTLAFDVVRQYHGADAAEDAAAYFYRQVQSRDLDAKVYEERTLGAIGLPAENLPLVELCAALEPEKSKSDIRRLIQEGAVTVDGERIDSIKHVFTAIAVPLEVKIGKRGFYRVAP